MPSSREADQPTQDWEELAKNLLKGEMKRRGVTYEDLARLLDDLGVRDNARNLANKVSRGSFSAAFFLQCMYALGLRTIHLD